MSFIDLKGELEQTMRKNRELAETKRQNLKEYTKLKLQYENVMSKSTIATSYGKTTSGQIGQPMFEAPQRPQTGLGNSRIGVSEVYIGSTRSLCDLRDDRPHQVVLSSPHHFSLRCVGKPQPPQHQRIYVPSI